VVTINLEIKTFWQIHENTLNRYPFGHSRPNLSRVDLWNIEHRTSKIIPDKPAISFIWCICLIMNRDHLSFMQSVKSFESIA
jgi:hypothetical protein